MKTKDLPSMIVVQQWITAIETLWDTMEKHEPGWKAYISARNGGLKASQEKYKEDFQAYKRACKEERKFRQQLVL